MKVLVLTDSNGNPRVSPEEDMIQLEETYPYVLRKSMRDSLFYQLSYGNITTENLLNQAIGYLLKWEPDIIIVHSGVCDCRPEAFTDFQKAIINNFSGPFFRYLKKAMNSPGLIKRRQVSRVSKRRFKKTLKKFKLLFNKSKIFWLDISVAPDYENTRPGIVNRIETYNNIIESTYGDDMVKVNKSLQEVRGHCTDSVHINKNGHEIISEALLNKINSYIKEEKGN